MSTDAVAADAAARARVRAVLREGTRSVRLEVARTVVLAAAAEVALRVLPLPRAARAFGAGVDVGAGTAPADGDPAELPRWAQRRIAYVGLVMDAWPRDGDCLRRSLVLAHRLRRLDPRLHLGVRREAGGVGAHAWVVASGVTLGAGDYLRLRDPRRVA